MPFEADDLKDVIGDPELASKLTDILYFTELLENCIVDKSYTVSDEWIKSIHLTTIGNSVVSDFLLKNQRVKRNDAVMCAFLRFGVSSGLLVSMTTDIDGLRKCLDEDMRRGRIYFPYIFGRDLHDVAAEIAPRKTHLSMTESLAVLRKLPMGVYQAGRTTVGPYGCVTAPVARQMPPSRSVPGYLCNDATCHAIHNILLATGSTSVSRAGQKFYTFLSAHHSELPNDHKRIVTEAQYRALAPHAMHGNDLINLLADSLSLDELRTVVNLLLRQNFRENGGPNRLSKAIGALIGDPAQFVASIGRPECIQLVLLHTNEDIGAALDKAVRQNLVCVQEYEVRRSRLNRWDSDVKAELGPLGLRYSLSGVGEYTALELMRLIHVVYYETDGLDPADLAYALEQSPTLSASSLIGIAMREKDPRELLQSLILPVRRAAAKAADFFSIAGFEDLSKEEFLERMCWKLGMPRPVVFSELVRVSSYESDFRKACRAKVSQDDLKAAGNKLFTAVEDCVQRSVIYTTWALTQDHYMASRGFEYDPELTLDIVSFIEDRAPASEPAFALRMDHRNTLQPLAASYARLAKALRRLKRDEFGRPEEQVPARAKSFPQPFAWQSLSPFLNLNANSRAEILTALQNLSRLLQDQQLIELRNSCSHGNNELPDPAVIVRVLDLVREWSDALWASGLFPRVYSLTNVVTDALGRVARTYSDSTDQVTLWSPEWSVAPRLPISDERIAVIPCAVIETSGPLRFRVKPRPGKEPYWDGYPRRWKVETTYSSERLANGFDDDLGLERSVS